MPEIAIAAPRRIGTGPETLAGRIVTLLDGARKNPDGLRFDESYLHATICEIISARAPLRLVLPTFHGKCPSRRLTIGDLPDQGEYLAIQTLAELHLRIADIYPATELHLLSEGHFHSDVQLLGSDQAVDNYIARIRDMIRPHSGLVLQDSDDLMPGRSHDEQRRILLAEHSPDENEMRCLMRADEQLLGLYTAYTKLHLKLLSECRDETVSGRQQRAQAKHRALLQLRKYLGFGRLLAKTYGPVPYVKMSALYKSPDQIDQLGVNVIKGNHQRGTTSFFAVMLQRNGFPRMMPAVEAARAGCRLVDTHAFPYFQEVQAPCVGTASFSTSTE